MSKHPPREIQLMSRMRKKWKELLSSVHGGQDHNTSVSVASGPYPRSVFDDPPWSGFGHERFTGFYSTEFLLYLPFHKIQNIVELVSVDSVDNYEVQIIADPLQAQVGDIKHLQAWFTFGFLESALGMFLDEQWLIKVTKDGRRVLCLDNVPQLLEKWNAAHSKDTKTIREKLRKFGQSINVCLATLSTLPKMMSAVETNSLTWLATFYTIICLGEYVHAYFVMLTRMHGIESGRVEGNPLAWMLHLNDWNYVWEFEFAQRHLCPSIINYIKNSANAMMFKVYVTSGMKEVGRHDMCERLQPCAAANIDERDYRTRHVCPYEDCGTIKVPYYKLMACLGAGEIPRVHLQVDDSGPRVNIRSYTSHSSTTADYVAFSHVWADGLGGHAEEGLPLCQVERLSRLASNLCQEGYFWIDSLCIPKEKALRAKSMIRINDVYRNAEAVIVLDSNLYNHSLPSDDILAVFHRMFAMQWMRRMWTLEEAVLARRKWFVFRDALVPLPSLQITAQERLSSLDMNAVLCNLQDILFPKPLDQYNFAKITAMLGTRSISKPADEPLVIAGLLSQDMGRLAFLEPEVRMEKLLLSIRHLPKSVAFLCPINGRLSAAGFTWAPRTFQGLPSQMTHATDGECTPNGLIAEYYTMSVRQYLRRHGRTLWMLMVDRDQKALFEVDELVGSDITGQFDMILLLDRPAQNFSPDIRAVLAQSVKTQYDAPNKQATSSIIPCTFVSNISLHRTFQGDDDFLESLPQRMRDEDDFCFVETLGWKTLCLG